MCEARILCCSLVAAALAAIAQTAYAQDAPAELAKLQSPRDVETIIEDYDEGRATFLESSARAESDDARNALQEEFIAKHSATIRAMIEIARAAPESEASMQAALWVVTHCDADFQPHVEAARILLRRHACDRRMSDAYDHLDGFDPVYEKILRSGSAAAMPGECRARAMFALADALVRRAAFKDAMDSTPELDAQRKLNMGPVVVEFLEAANRDQDRLEATRLFHQVVDEFADIPYRDQTLGQMAADRLMSLEQTYPEIGRNAPRASGTDLSGHALDLLEFRGKVVVIVAWASWCGACCERIPYENKLVEQFKDADFVLLGINGDKNLDDALRAKDKYKIAFRSWRDEPSTDVRIIDQFGVTTWPTTFVIDQDGVVRNKNLDGPELHAAIVRLLGAR